MKTIIGLFLLYGVPITIIVSSAKISATDGIGYLIGYGLAALYGLFVGLLFQFYYEVALWLMENR